MCVFRYYHLCTEVYIYMCKHVCLSICAYTLAWWVAMDVSAHGLLLKHVYIHLYVHTYKLIFGCMQTHVCVCAHVCGTVCVHACDCAYLCVRIGVCVCVPTRGCTYASFCMSLCGWVCTSLTSDIMNDLIMTSRGKLGIYWNSDLSQASYQLSWTLLSFRAALPRLCQTAS